MHSVIRRQPRVVCRVPPLGVVLNLCYPEGFSSGDGALKLIPGSHLYRNVSPMGDDGATADDDGLRRRGRPREL